MKDSLIFSFHAQGCTLLISKDDHLQVIAELSGYDCLRQLPVNAPRLFAFMAHCTECYFSLKDEGTQVPQAFYDAWQEKGGS